MERNGIMGVKSYLYKKLNKVYSNCDLIEVKISDIKHSGLGKTTVNKSVVPWGDEYVELEKKIESEGYLPEKYGYPMVTSNMYCINGNHRIAILNDKFGEDKVVKVEKIKKKFIYVFFLSLVLVLFGHKE